MRYQGRNEFEHHIMAGKIPSYAGAPGYVYVRIPDDDMAARAELFGVPFYNIHISESNVYQIRNGYPQYEIRYKDVRHACSRWRHDRCSAPNIDAVHQRLKKYYEMKMIDALQNQIYRDTRETRRLSSLNYAEPNAQPPRHGKWHNLIGWAK